MRAAISFDSAEAAVASETSRTNLAGDPLISSAPGFTSFTDPQPVIWAGLGDDPMEPVQAVTYIADNYENLNAERPERWLFVADAATSEILYKENLIHFTDVSGNVSGRATVGNAAEHCEIEEPTVLPWARVNIGTTVAWTDENGDYTIPNGGITDVTVQSRLWGTWFRVYNQAGSDEVLSRTVTPPGPAEFMHNDSNTSEYVRAQVNGYVQANAIRKLVIAHNPTYPGMSQNEFPIYVNRTDGYCPGNAWYDYTSINFCSSSGSYPNTAWSSVIHHEYGHHLVSMAGSGQDQYGEGMGDVMSILTSDSPDLGLGFFGNCSSPLRTADNNYQYPCTGEAHDCGNLLSGCVWSLRNQLTVTEPADYLDILSNLAINAMLMHSGSTITPQITIDYLVLDDDDAYIGNGTPHYNEIDTGFGAHNMPAPELDLLRIEYPDGLPSIVSPSEDTTVRVNVIGVAGTPEPGTGALIYRVGGGSYASAAIIEIAPNEYEATIPASECFDLIDFYFLALTADSQTVTDPPDAPASFHTVVVATELNQVFADDFETNQGWTVQNSSGLGDGPWDRGVPAGGGERGDPPTDFDGSGSCYLTDNVYGNSDVDDGYTWLISPTIDLSSGDAEIHYALWYTNYFGADPENDLFKVYVSNNNGSSWTLVETIGPQTSAGWTEYVFTVGSFVTPTAQVKVRFEASDLNAGSVVEAGIDDFSVNQFICEEIECFGDLDGNLVIDLADLAQLLSNYGMTSGGTYEDGDLDGDGDVDLSDLAALLGVYGVPC